MGGGGGGEGGELCRGNLKFWYGFKLTSPCGDPRISCSSCKHPGYFDVITVTS